MFEQSFTILSELGLHARAATRLVQTASRFTAEVEIERDGERVSGKSVMEVLTLFAARGSKITVRSRGVDAEAELRAIGALIARNFDDGPPRR